MVAGYKTFKEFYLKEVFKHWKADFPGLVSYNRIGSLIPWSLMVLSCFLATRIGKMTGIAFIDSTPIEVCHPRRAKSHKVFGDLPQWGKNSIGWYYGFKLHLIINDQGELLAFQLTPANTDDRQPVPDLTQHLLGKLFGDKGYISQSLFEQLYQRGLKKRELASLVKEVEQSLSEVKEVVDHIDSLEPLAQKWNLNEDISHLMSSLLEYQTRHYVHSHA